MFSETPAVSGTSQPAISLFYPCRALFPDFAAVFPKRRKKAAPIIRRYPAAACPQPFYPLPQLSRRFHLPFPPDKRRDFPSAPMMRVNKPYFILFFPHTSKIRLFQGNHNGFVSAASDIQSI
jgi:hypothetical protein